MEALLKELIMPVLKGALVAAGLVACGWMVALIVPEVMIKMRKLRDALKHAWQWLVRLWMGRVPIQTRGLLLAMGLSAILGAGVMWRMGNRFEIVRSSGGLVMRLDRWTGKTWRLDYQGGRWNEVRE
jgi:hypothetical protein